MAVWNVGGPSVAAADSGLPPSNSLDAADEFSVAGAERDHVTRSKWLVKQQHHPAQQVGSHVSRRQTDSQTSHT